jgi:hypothetical protein
MKLWISIITSFLLTAGCSLFAQADTLAENQARFGVITGDVGLLALGAAEWIEPHEGLPIEPGDHIRTGEDGKVEVIMGENVFWMLQPLSEIVTEHIETNAGRLNLVAGSLLGKVDSARTAGIAQQWEFNTPAAVVAIRGTEFGLAFTKTEGSRLGVFEGTVEVEPAETAEGLQPPVQINAGQEALAHRGKPIKTLAQFSPAMQKLNSLRAPLQRRQRVIQNTWSPFTPAVRSELRRKFVAPAPKRVRIHPHPTRVHKATSSLPN